jgi:hypothetical protein
MEKEHQLKTYRRTNKYHVVNDTQIAMNGIKIYIYCINDDVYELEFNYYDHLFNDYMASDFYILRNLSFETLRKIIKPPSQCIISDNTCCNRRSILYYVGSSAIEKATQQIRTAKLRALIDNKLHETETAFRQKLKKNRQIDCIVRFVD